MKIHLKNTSQLTDFINNTSRLTLLAIDYQPLQSSMIEDSSIHRGFRISRGLPDHPYRFRFTNNVGNSSNSAHGCVVYEYVKPLYTLKGSDCLGSFRILALPRRTLIVIPNTVSQHALNQHFLGEYMYLFYTIMIIPIYIHAILQLNVCSKEQPYGCNYGFLNAKHVQAP